MSQNPAPSAEHGKRDLAFMANERCQSSSRQARLHPTESALLWFCFSYKGTGFKLQWVCGVKSGSFEMTQKRGSADPACFLLAPRAVTSFLCRILSFLRYSVGKNTHIRNMHKCMPTDHSGSGGITVWYTARKGPR